MGGYENLGLSELTNRQTKLWRQLVAEFAGTMLIVFFGCGSTIGPWSDDANAVSTADNSQIVLKVAFAFGLSVMVAVEAFGHTSGAHVNPAITVAMLLVRKIRLVPGLLYIGVQLLGGVAGAALLKALTPGKLADTLGYNFINPKITAGQGLVVELVATFILVLVVFSVTDELRLETKGAASLAIGLTVVLGHIFSINYTNCGMNPARVFGPAVMANYWDDHWVYWIGECAGGILAAILYVALFSADDSGLYNRLFKSVCGSATISNNGENGKENIPVSTVSVERISP